MTDREIAITLIVLISAVSILTTPFMLMKRGQARAVPVKRSPLGWALVIASNVAITVLLLWLGFYLYQNLS
ncbi:hypothetical protein LVJ82_18265 [Vitreoscilla massiliensis]|uniref:Uncharacterized protein n=1 Tax=Vitreoscilla massiliensis TaxID=1689272 RepID=A0ABY4E1Y0_9NEIS|nr:hypothetical protein [Vitreoscilla massiliensis]UOO89361.1 hypothetical protein LVJ82_18265 [Vitreoscilla massiliensis]